MLYQQTKPSSPGLHDHTVPILRVTSTLNWSCGAEQLNSTAVAPLPPLSRRDELQRFWRPNTEQTWQPLTWELLILMSVPRSGVMVKVRAAVRGGDGGGGQEVIITDVLLELLV